MTDSLLARGRESATEPVLTSRLLPRVSFRFLLVFTAISAVIIAVVYSADQGGVYASAMAIGLFFAFTVFACAALVFLLTWAVSFLPRVVGLVLLAFGLVALVCRLTGILLPGPATSLGTVGILGFLFVGAFLLVFPIGGKTESAATSPFAEDQLPPQIFAPREPSNG